MPWVGLDGFGGFCRPNPLIQTVGWVRLSKFFLLIRPNPTHTTRKTLISGGKFAVEIGHNNIKKIETSKKKNCGEKFPC